MQGIDAFLDTYVRIDEGTAVLLCAHRSCARTAAWLYAAIFVRGTEPSAFCFEFDDESAESEALDMLATLRDRPGVRRVVIIVCEPAGPSLARTFETQQAANPHKVAIFRLSGSTTNLFDAGSKSPAQGKRGRRTEEASWDFDSVSDEDSSAVDEQSLSQGEIDELMAQCEFEMADLPDWDIEEIAAMTAEEIGSLTDEELAALAELEDSELLELVSGWDESDFRVLA